MFEGLYVGGDPVAPRAGGAAVIGMSAARPGAIGCWRGFRPWALSEQGSQRGKAICLKGSTLEVTP